ncbi:NrfD/PsrC family molybdoenzyme membrane anchor subunit [Bacteroidota bacterium]
MNKVKKIISPWLIILYGFSAIAIALIIYRFNVGLGASTNHSDGYPWGILIGANIMAGIALTTGGLIMAIVVNVFGREKYKHLYRAAILTAFLGYIMEIFALFVDLGRSIEMWHSILYWNNASPMFLVGWCVILYGTILALEFTSILLEKNKLLKRRYDIVASILGIIIMTFFIFLMSANLIYTITTFLLFTILWILFKSLLSKANIQIILIIVGIVISIIHQSSLGILYLMVPFKLAAPWYTTLLPIDSILTAICVGLAMIIIESIISIRVYRIAVDSVLIRNLSKAMVWVILLTLLFKFVVLYIQNGLIFNATTKQLLAFWIEVGAGLILPLILLILPVVKKTEKAILWISIMVVGGVILNRANIVWIGQNIENYPVYYPHIFEILITIGIFSMTILLFYHICKRIPIFEKG